MNLKGILKRSFNYILRGIPNNYISADVRVTQPNNLLKGKTLVITGGAKGIGLAIARKCVSEGATVIITGRDKDALVKASQSMECDCRVLDMCDIDAFDDFTNEIIKQHGKIDGIVNNAGISLHENNIFEVTPENWDKQINTNLKGPFFLTQKIIKHFIETKVRGNILFISSEAGNTCDIRPYGFTKGAINSMVRGLAYRYKLDGIRINAIAPGITASDMTGVGKDGNYYAGTYGQGRFYLPEEIAEVAAFLLSDVSDCISGQIITCNNAQTVNARWKN